MTGGDTRAMKLAALCKKLAWRRKISASVKRKATTNKSAGNGVGINRGKS